MREKTKMEGYTELENGTETVGFIHTPLGVPTGGFDYFRPPARNPSTRSGQAGPAQSLRMINRPCNFLARASEVSNFQRIDSKL